MRGTVAEDPSQQVSLVRDHPGKAKGGRGLRSLHFIISVLGVLTLRLICGGHPYVRAGLRLPK